MANENKPNQPQANDKPAPVDNKPVAARTPAMPRASDFELDPATGLLKTGNLTRDSLVGTLKARFVEAGKSDAEAMDLAVARAFEMIQG